MFVCVCLGCGVGLFCFGFLFGWGVVCGCVVVFFVMGEWAYEGGGGWVGVGVCM